MFGNSKRALALLLTLVVCFGGLVIFSSLHKHDRGKCSLGNLEGCQPDILTSQTPLSVPKLAHRLEVSEECVSASAFRQTLLPARAPPTISV